MPQRVRYFGAPRPSYLRPFSDLFSAGRPRLSRGTLALGLGIAAACQCTPPSDAPANPSVSPPLPLEQPRSTEPPSTGHSVSRDGEQEGPSAHGREGRETLPRRHDYADYTIFEHGKDCFEAMDQKPLPPINCMEGTLLPVTKDGVEYRQEAPDVCDKPDLVDPLVACMPGTRLRVHESPDKNVLSVYMCRRMPRAPGNPIDVNDPTTENIAIFQFNRRNQNVCWFQIRKNIPGIRATHLVAPYTEGRVKGDADDRAAQDLYVAPGDLVRGEPCVGCHDSQVFLRTPFIEQARHAPNPLDRRNTWNDDDVFHGRLFHVGAPFEAWNRDENQPKRLRIQRAAYDAMVPLRDDERADLAAGRLAPSDACTSCHTIGKSPLRSPNADEGSCDNFVREWVDPTYHGPVTSVHLSATGKAWPQSHWMPPGQASRFAHRADFERYYRRALGAVKTCCLQPDLQAPDGTKPCLGSPATDAP